jgi:hypothetical protein
LMQSQVEQYIQQTTAEEQHVQLEFPLPFVNPPTFSQRVSTSEDWDFYRPVIIRLYRDDDHTLKEVMQIMRTQHNFNATTKMYKSRLTSWDIRKYMTWAERETACRVLKLKQGAGEASGKVIVRGKARNPDVFLRHMGQSRAANRRKELLANNRNLEDIVIGTWRKAQSGSQILPTMYPAGPQRTIEIVCKETLSLTLTMVTPETMDTGVLYNLLHVGIDCLRGDRPAELRVILNRAASWSTVLLSLSLQMRFCHC